MRDNPRLLFHLSLLALLVLAAACGGSPKNDGRSGLQRGVPAAPVDSASGLIMAGDWGLVRDRCIDCHAAYRIMRRHRTEQQWRDVIRLMQAQQGMGKLAPATEKRILDYLTTWYGPQSPGDE